MSVDDGSVGSTVGVLNVTFDCDLVVGRIDAAAASPAHLDLVAGRRFIAAVVAPPAGATLPADVGGG